jgi:hypothetical protein
VKLVAEYLDRAHEFERLAADESNPKLKEDLEKQAAAYRKLAEKRAATFRNVSDPADDVG